MKSVGLRTLGAGLIIGSILGFIFANATYRSFGESERSGLKMQKPAQNTSFEQTNNSKQSVDSPPTSENAGNDNALTISELRQAIIKADGNKDNLALQRNLGIALFRYAVLEQNTDLLPDAVRLLERADQKIYSKDKELYQTLGNALFVLAQQQGPEKMPLARVAYQKALQITPNDKDLLINIGLTYFLAQPSNPTAAIVQYTQALRLQPLDEKALENLIRALLAIRQTTKAAESLKRLQQINPQNKALNDLETQFTQQQLDNK